MQPRILLNFITITVLLLSLNPNLNAQGFAASPTFWPVPLGGQVSNNNDQGFITTDDYATFGEDDGSEIWRTMDINGDGKLDLVVTAELSGGDMAPFDNGGPVWKVFLNSGSGFASSATFWSLPPGGQDGLNNSGFYTTDGLTSSGVDNGSDLWSTFDINGDSKPDLVVTGEVNNNAPFVTDNGGPVWQVYLNNGSGFAQSPTFWPVPSGGQISNGQTNGFYTTTDLGSFGEDDNSELWTTTDMNGDNRPDLVICSYRDGGVDVVSYNGGPVWQVYLNNGSGFAASPTFWSLPSGGQVEAGGNEGFWLPSKINFIGDDDGSQLWAQYDMNGDGRRDLVVSAEKVSGTYTVSDNGGPVWRVYTNTGTGYSPNPTFWSLPPASGQIITNGINGFWYPADSGTFGEEENSQIWHLLDLNNDDLLDLVVTGRLSSGLNGVNTNGGNAVWQVYENNGNGFASSPTLWTVPAGGQVSSNTDLGFYAAGHLDFGSDDDGSEQWTTIDMDGNGSLDLVVTSEIVSGTQQIGNNGVPVWKVYMNDSSTGINFLNKEEIGFGIYPNPTNDILVVELASFENPVDFSIVDVLGKEWQSGLLKNATTELQIDELPKGLYFLVVNEEAVSFIIE